MFYQTIKRVSIDIAEYLALTMGVLFYYYKMGSFIHAAIMLGYVNGQTVSYLLYSFVLILLPIALLYCFKRLQKASVLRWIFYAHAAVIFLGTYYDIRKYNWFIDYTFLEGDAIFVNLLWNMPNALGIVMSITIGALYIVLGKLIKKKRRLSYITYFTITLLSHLPPIIYSFATIGTWPRETYLQKSIYVMAIQILILIAFSIAATSRSLWSKHIWH